MEFAHSQFFIQLLGFLGLAAYVSSYQIKSNKKLFFVQFLGILMFILQFVLLRAYSGCFNLLIGAVRNILLINYKKKAWIRWWGWPVIFTCAFAVATVLTWKNYLSIFPFISMTACTWGYWTNKPRPIRLANAFVASPSWIIYDVAIGSWGGVMNELLTIGSVAISIYRYGWKNLGKGGAEYED